MSRKKKHSQRISLPDPVYGDPKVMQFICYLMKDGKKKLASRIFNDALGQVAEETGNEGIEVWRKAIEQVTPTIESKKQTTRRTRGAARSVPVEVRPKRRVYLAMNWLIQGAKKNSGRSMKEKLAKEIVAASTGEGNAMKKKMTIFKMAESNKAFSHIRAFQ